MMEAHVKKKNNLPKVIKDNGNPMISRKEPQPEINLLVTENVNENSPHNVDKSNENILKSKTISTKTNQKIDSKQECKKKPMPKCLWNNYHSNKLSLKNDSTIQNIPVIDNFGVPAAGLQVITRKSNKDILLKNKENVEEKTDKKLLELTKDISSRLNENVYSKEGEYIINQTRIILDLPKLAIKVKSEGFVVVALTEYSNWIEAVRNINIEDLNKVSDDDLKSQFKLYLSRLEIMTRDYSVKDLTDLDSKILIRNFFDPDKKLYLGIEMILHSMAVASIKQSCESILESFVSKYENHFDARRNVDEETANEEFEIAVNGPNLAHSNSIIIEAMDLYWKGKPWHFYRTSSIKRFVNPNGISCVLNRLDSIQNHLPIMN